MTYLEQSERYRDMAERDRYEMCVREQGYIHATAADPSKAALGRGVTAGSMADIDAVIAAICVGANSALLGDDGDLLSAVNTAWPTVAAARYPDAGAA
jgi:hypothetical protein